MSCLGTSSIRVNGVRHLVLRIGLTYLSSIGLTSASRFSSAGRSGDYENMGYGLYSANRRVLWWIRSAS